MEEKLRQLGAREEAQKNKQRLKIKREKKRQRKGKVLKLGQMCESSGRRRDSRFSFHY